MQIQNKKRTTSFVTKYKNIETFQISVQILQKGIFSYNECLLLSSFNTNTFCRFNSKVVSL